MEPVVSWLYKHTGNLLSAALAIYLAGWGVLSMSLAPLSVARWFVVAGCLWFGLVGAVWILRTSDAALVRAFVGLAVGAVVFWVLPETLRYITSRDAQPRPQTASTSTPIKPLSLRELFETDWPNLPAYYMVSEIKSDGLQSKTVQIAWRLNGDFVARSRFFAIFLDSEVSPADAVFASEAFAEKYGFFLETADKNVDISGQSPDDTAPTHLKDMVFSKRIFIYYENQDFSLSKKAAIEGNYETRGLSVQFRDAAYTWSHRDDHLVPISQALVPNAVILPDAADIPGLSINFMNIGSDNLTVTTRKQQKFMDRNAHP